MAYVPGDLIIDPWTAPLRIAETDYIKDLDNAVNDIIQDDPGSMNNYLNNQLAKIPGFMSNEFEKIYAETEDSAIAAKADADRAAAAADRAEDVIGASIDDTSIGLLKTFSSQRIAKIGGKKNFLMNGGFSVWQRGIDFEIKPGHPVYTADRWKASVGLSAEHVFIRNVQEGMALLEYSGSSTEKVTLEQTIEDGYVLKDKTVVLSFNTDATVGECYYFVPAHGNTRIFPNTPFTIRNDFIEPVTISCEFIVSPPYAKLYGIQLELGEVATDLEYVPYSEELVRCLRYCERIDGTMWAMDYNGGSKNMIHFPFKARKRVHPTIYTNITYDVDYTSVDAVALYMPSGSASYIAADADY